jgi:hypothetical protein
VKVRQEDARLEEENESSYSTTYWRRERTINTSDDVSSTALQKVRARLARSTRQKREEGGRSKAEQSNYCRRGETEGSKRDFVE